MRQKIKRTEYITIRTTPETKEYLEKIAEERRWTLSQTAALVLEAYCRDEGKTLPL